MPLRTCYALGSLGGGDVSISDNPMINCRIEQVLAGHSPEEQTIILDALEGIGDAGADGISVTAWADHMRSLHPDLQVGPVLSSVLKEFPFCIRRLAPKLYGWDETQADDDEVDPDFLYAVRSQVDLTYDTLAAMRAMGEFSKPELVACIVRQSGAPRQQAAIFAEHLLTQFMGSIEKIGPDRCRMKVERPNTTDDSMKLLHEIANRHGRNDDEYDWQNPEKTSPPSKS